MGQPDSAPQQSSSPGENKGARKPVQVGDTFEVKRLDQTKVDKMTREKAGKRTYTRTERKRGRYIKSRPAGLSGMPELTAMQGYLVCPRRGR